MVPPILSSPYSFTLSPFYTHHGQAKGEASCSGEVWWGGADSLPESQGLLLLSHFLSFLLLPWRREEQSIQNWHLHLGWGSASWDLSGCIGLFFFLSPSFSTLYKGVQALASQADLCLFIILFWASKPIILSFSNDNYISGKNVFVIW